MSIPRESLLLVICGLLANCSSGASPATGVGVAGSTNGGANASAGAAGGAGIGQVLSGGAGGFAGAVGGDSSAGVGGNLPAASGNGGGGADAGGAGSSAGGGASSSGAPGAGGAASGGTAGASGAGGASSMLPFTCTLLVGPSTMAQWFNGGFLSYPGIDATRWQLLMVAHHYTNVWAMPGDAAWKTAISHPCANGSKTPDRVAFMATQWAETTQAQWEADFVGIIKNIQANWPMVKRIEFMPSPCAPGDKLCPGATVASETIIPAYGYAAIDAMPAQYPGLVFSTPHFEVPKCSDFIGNGTSPQYAPDAAATTGPAVTDLVNVFGAYYAAHP
jgi:hypothetical protein